MQRSHFAWVAAAALVCAVPWVINSPYYLDVAIRIAINACIVIGLNLLVGYAGQISLGHAGFFGLGAYASAILTTTHGWPALPAMLLAASATGLLAFILARPILRLRSHYLAMATLGMGLIVSIVIATETSLSGGPDGMPVAPLVVGGFTFSGERHWFWLMGAVLLLVTALARNLIRSPYGRALQALHGSEVAAKVVGVETTRIKVSIFVISAIVASLMGSLYAHYLGFITPTIASFLHSIELITMVVVGGMASIGGSILGAVLLTLLPQLLTSFEGWETVVYGAILIVTMVFLPKGLVPSLRKLWVRSGK